MSTEPTRRSLRDWKRWTQTSKQFPGAKYGFSKLLKHKGDYLVTFPLSYDDAIRFKDAAKFWARYHDCRVTINRMRNGDGTFTVKVMLVEKHRHELPHRLQRGPEKYL